MAATGPDGVRAGSGEAALAEGKEGGAKAARRKQDRSAIGAGTEAELAENTCNMREFYEDACVRTSAAASAGDREGADWIDRESARVPALGKASAGEDSHAERGIPELLPGERVDDLQTGGLRLIQRQGTFCLGTDSVLLADFAAPRKGERIADLGCGNGAIALLLAGHRSDAVIEAVELQPELADMARRSVWLNGLEEHVHIHCIDMQDAWRTLGRESCSLVVCNPPYGAPNSGTEREPIAERTARGGLDPATVASSAAAILKYGGRFCACYPARRAHELLFAMREAKLAPKRIRCIQPRPDRAPRLILLEGVKGGGSGLEWLPPLWLYDEDGEHSEEWRRIYGEE